MNIAAWILLVCAQTCWSASYTLSKICLAEMSVGMVLFLRYSIAALIFIAVFLIKGFPKISRSTLFVAIGIGFLNFSISSFLQVKALEFTQAIDISILILFEPIITVVFASFILKEKISKQVWWVLFFSMIGFALISNISFGANAGYSAIRILGNAIFLSSLVSEAFTSTLGKYFTKRMSAFESVGLLTIFGAIFICLFQVKTWMNFPYSTISTKVWLSVIGMSLGCSIFAYVAWYYVIAKIPMQYVALSLFLQPVIGSILGATVLGETMTYKSLVGTIVICGSLLWWQIQSHRKITQI